MVGEIAGLLTAISWSFTSIFFTIAAKKAGSIVVNRLRLAFASVMLMTVHIILFGNLLPVHAELYRWSWLGLSGIIGLVIGDTMLLQAFICVGTRISMLLLSLVPIFSTILAWLFLGEVLTLVEIVAILMTIAGIAWVVLEKNNGNAINNKHFKRGIIFGLGGAIGQALALITAKKGLGGDFSPLSATLIRIFVAAIAMWVFSILNGSARSTFEPLREKKFLGPVLGGSLFGPVIGIWLSLVSIKHANIGIASTLMALPPILLLPLTYWFFKESISVRSALGTLITIAGVALIFLV